VTYREDSWSAKSAGGPPARAHIRRECSLISTQGGSVQHLTFSIDINKKTPKPSFFTRNAPPELGSVSMKLTGFSPRCSRLRSAARCRGCECVAAGCVCGVPLTRPSGRMRLKKNTLAMTMAIRTSVFFYELYLQVCLCFCVPSVLYVLVLVYELRAFRNWQTKKRDFVKIHKSVQTVFLCDGSCIAQEFVISPRNLRI
jgi:hypothetical protein